VAATSITKTYSTHRHSEERSDEESLFFFPFQMNLKPIIKSIYCVTALLAGGFSLRTQDAAEYKARADSEKSWPKEAVRGVHGMVATDEELASRAGVEILQRGGNAVDAAVATAFALAVVEPAAGNIGGGGFMLVRMADGRSSFLDYREVAPGKATREMYIKPDGKLDEVASVIGYKSVAVPGTVAGLGLALKTYGKLKLADVMA
jgi:gamma-glutamyltranspeptidase/glutathione hydrolase